MNNSAKLQSYIAIIKINAKQLINAMNIANETNEKYLLANVIDDVVNNLITFNIPNNPLFGDVCDSICNETIWKMHDDGELPFNDFCPNIDNCLYPEQTIEYLKTLSNECLNNWENWKKSGKLSVYSSNSLLCHVFGDYTTKHYIWNN